MMIVLPAWQLLRPMLYTIVAVLTLGLWLAADVAGAQTLSLTVQGSEGCIPAPCVDEDVGQILFFLTLDQPLPGGQSATVRYSIDTSSSSARESVDYSVGPEFGIAHFSESVSSVTFAVMVIDDDLVDANHLERIFVAVDVDSVTPTDVIALISPDRVRVDIADNNDVAMVGLSSRDLNVNEGDGRVTVQARVLSGQLEEGLTIMVGASVQDGSDATPAVSGNDYVGFAPRQLNFDANTLSHDLVVMLVDDDAAENDEQFSIILSLVTVRPNIVVSPSGALVNIVDDDDVVRVSIADAEVAENGGAARFEVSLSKALDEDVTVAWATSDATATGGADYTAVTAGMMAISAQALSTTIEVIVLDDALIEGNENFMVTLTTPSSSLPDGVGLGDAVATGLIRDDDTIETMGTISPRTLVLEEAAEVDRSVEVDVATAFSADANSWTAVSDTPDVVTVAVSGSVVTLTPAMPGAAMITVTAHHASVADASAEQTFMVTVRQRATFTFTPVPRRVTAGGSLPLSVSSDPAAATYALTARVLNSSEVETVMVMPATLMSGQETAIGFVDTEAGDVIEVTASTTPSGHAAAIEGGFLMAVTRSDFTLGDLSDSLPVLEAGSAELEASEGTLAPGAYALALARDFATIPSTATMHAAPPGYAEVEGGVFDFSVSGVAAGGTVSVLIPLLDAAPQGVRLFKHDGGWNQFTSGGEDEYYGAPPPCPAIDAPRNGEQNAWRAAGNSGMQAGEQCLLLRITDGGINDADGTRNGIVYDPSTLFGNAGDGGSGGSGGGGAVSGSWLLAMLLPVALRRARRVFSDRSTLSV